MGQWTPGEDVVARPRPEPATAAATAAGGPPAHPEQQWWGDCPQEWLSLLTSLSPYAKPLYHFAQAYPEAASGPPPQVWVTGEGPVLYSHLLRDWVKWLDVGTHGEFFPLSVDSSARST